MKKFALALFALPLMFGMHAKADVSAESLVPHAYTCELTGYMRGLNVAIGVGGEVIRGNGTLSCNDSATGRSMDIPVKLSLLGAGAGLEVSLIKRIDVHTAGIKVTDPREFYRSYGIGATTGGTLLAGGVEFDTAFRVNSGSRGAGFEVGLQGRDALGLGVHLYGMVFKIAKR